jgi:hypothetical protein
MVDTTLTLDLRAKKQSLRKRITLFATTDADSTLVATGRRSRGARRSAANQKTKVMAKLKRAMRERLQKKLAKKGRMTLAVVPAPESSMRQSPS